MQQRFSLKAIEKEHVTKYKMSLEPQSLAFDLNHPYIKTEWAGLKSLKTGCGLPVPAVLSEATNLKTLVFCCCFFRLEGF